MEIYLNTVQRALLKYVRMIKVIHINKKPWGNKGGRKNKK